jgi:RNA polymerase sigma-70 factor (ECF subfamily)
MQPPPPEVTQLLLAWSAGDQAALDRLMPLVYEELRRQARRHLRRERHDHSLQTTALVNEAYLRMVDLERVRFENRAHFFAISARLLRQILVDLARRRKTQKRGGGAQRIALSDAIEDGSGSDIDLAQLDEALKSLAEFDARKGQVVELRFFGGLTEEETASVLHVSPETVRRDWRLAKAWLRRFLSEEEPHDA